MNYRMGEVCGGVVRATKIDLRAVKLIRGLVIMFATLSLVACASGPPSHSSDESPGDANGGSSEYSIGSGDSLQIFVWGHADLSTTVQVRPDGKISTPLVEDLQAAGRTPTQLARDIETVLKEYVRTPVATVIMQGFVGEGSQQIRVVGQAASPTALQYHEGMTVLDVIIEVGGLTEFAAGNRAKIIRKTGNSESEIKVRLDDLINDGDISENVRMRPGDVLIIPQSFF
jgi:polysaccharide export outer membrane protein